ncbi:MAG: hypothetical protein IT521_09585 [Burkholderiales bacterium]|nr:hypothetical protein [Burkholderiales bacterium]
MAVVVLVVSVALEPVPFAGFVAANIIAPLLACGLLYASLAADREGRPRFRDIAAVFVAPLPALATVLVASLAVLAVQAFAAWRLAGVNLLLPLADSQSLSGTSIVAIYAIGVLVSLPVTFVPMAALFDGERMRESLALSLRAAALNLAPLALFATYSFALLMLGLMTMGAGLVLAVPWIAAASYAAWKDVFGLDRATGTRLLSAPPPPRE